jgi:hypothetical protein
MLWRRAEESNPYPGPSRSAGFRDQKALPSLRALRWSESRDSNPVRAVLRTAASTTSAFPTWHTREELNPESQFWRLLPSPSGRVCNWWAYSESNREKQPLLRRHGCTDLPMPQARTLVRRERFELSSSSV